MTASSDVGGGKGQGNAKVHEADHDPLVAGVGADHLGPDPAPALSPGHHRLTGLELTQLRHRPRLQLILHRAEIFVNNLNTENLVYTVSATALLTWQV